ARDDTRYRPGLVEAIYWLLTLSTALRAAAEILLGLLGAPRLGWLVAAGGLGQLAAAVLFVLNMWWRVRIPTAAAPPARSRPRHRLGGGGAIRAGLRSRGPLRPCRSRAPGPRPAR